MYLKFNIHFTTYLFFLCSFLCGFFKNAIIIFLVVFIHELGHILVIKMCHYKIIKIEFYPFGGLTKIDKPINSSITKEMFISMAGIFFQLILGLLLVLNKNNISNYQLWQMYNLTIIFFNLLPIIPLDGSIFWHSFLEKKFSYEQAFHLYQLVSIIFFIFFLLANYYFNFHNYYICGILIYQFFLLKKQEKYLFHRFYLERYLKEYPYKKICNHKKNNVHVLKKEVKHYFYQNNKYIDEKEMIKRTFWVKK